MTPSIAHSTTVRNTEAFVATLLDRAEIAHHRFILDYGPVMGRLVPAAVPALMRLYVERHLHLLLQEMAPGTEALLDYDDDSTWTRDTPPNALIIQRKGSRPVRVPIRWSSRGRAVTFEPPQSALQTVIVTNAEGGERLAEALIRLVAETILPDQRDVA